MGGTVDLKTDSQGTEFSLYFPKIDRPEETPSLEGVFQNVTILVIDDDKDVRTGLEELLVKAGCDVLLAEDGVEGLGYLQITEVDLILLDNTMPRMGGRDTLLGIRHLRPATPVVVYSSYLTDNDRQSLGELGVHEFLDKPASPNDILRVVDQHLTLTA